MENHITPRHANLIFCLTALILEYHHLEFEERFYCQIKGIAMGSNFAVVYACFFLGHQEQQQQKPTELIYYKRYIDDAFGLWNGDEAPK